ncbi:MAG: cell division protein ZapA [Flavobacteriales bacterium]
MSQQSKVKFSVASRSYPMHISKDNEEAMRRGVKLIETQLKQIEKKYAMKDKQDALAMCCIRLAGQLEILKDIELRQGYELKAQIEEMDKFLDELET